MWVRPKAVKKADEMDVTTVGVKDAQMDESSVGVKAAQKVGRKDCSAETMVAMKDAMMV